MVTHCNISVDDNFYYFVHYFTPECNFIHAIAHYDNDLHDCYHFTTAASKILLWFSPIIVHMNFCTKMKEKTGPGKETYFVLLVISVLVLYLHV